MTDFKVGDIVYIKDDYVKIYKCHLHSVVSTALLLTQEQSFDTQMSLAKDIPLTIVGIKGRNGFCVTNLDDSWGRRQNNGRGFMWNGKEYKTWILGRDDIEKRESLNTVSLYELNRGL